MGFTHRPKIRAEPSGQVSPTSPGIGASPVGGSDPVPANRRITYWLAPDTADRPSWFRASETKPPLDEVFPGIVTVPGVLVNCMGVPIESPEGTGPVYPGARPL